MNEEEREIVKKFERLYLKDFNNEKITNEDRLSYIECALMTNLIEKLQKELKQKDKIIDLMAETINNHDIDEDICKQMGQKANCNEFEDTEKCKECIKQYFINKAKEIR